MVDQRGQPYRKRRATAFYQARSVSDDPDETAEEIAESEALRRQVQQILTVDPKNRSEDQLEILSSVLSEVRFFQGIDPEIRLKFVRVMRMKRVPANGVVFFEGDPGELFYVILSGSVGVYSDTNNVLKQGRENIQQKTVARETVSTKAAYEDYEVMKRATTIVRGIEDGTFEVPSSDWLHRALHERISDEELHARLGFAPPQVPRKSATANAREILEERLARLPKIYRRDEALDCHDEATLAWLHTANLRKLSPPLPRLSKRGQKQRGAFVYLEDGDGASSSGEDDDHLERFMHRATDAEEDEDNDKTFQVTQSLLQGASNTESLSAIAYASSRTARAMSTSGTLGLTRSMDEVARSSRGKSLLQTMDEVARSSREGGRGSILGVLPTIVKVPTLDQAPQEEGNSDSSSSSSSSLVEDLADHNVEDESESTLSPRSNGSRSTGQIKLQHLTPDKFGTVKGLLSSTQSSNDDEPSETKHKPKRKQRRTSGRGRRRSSAMRRDQIMTTDMVKTALTEVTVLHQGAAFGEVALQTKQPRSATMMTKEDSVLATLSAVDYQEIMSQVMEQRSQAKQEFLMTVPCMQKVMASNIVKIAYMLLPRQMRRTELLYDVGSQITQVYIIKEGEMAIGFPRRREEEHHEECSKDEAATKTGLSKEAINVFSKQVRPGVNWFVATVLPPGAIAGLPWYLRGERRSREQVRCLSEKGVVYCIFAKDLIALLPREVRVQLQTVAHAQERYHDNRVGVIRRLEGSCQPPKERKGPVSPFAASSAGRAQPLGKKSTPPPNVYTTGSRLGLIEDALMKLRQAPAPAPKEAEEAADIRPIWQVEEALAAGHGISVTSKERKRRQTVGTLSAPFAEECWEDRRLLSAFEGDVMHTGPPDPPPRVAAPDEPRSADAGPRILQRPYCIARSRIFAGGRHSLRQTRADSPLPPHPRNLAPPKFPVQRPPPAGGCMATRKDAFPFEAVAPLVLPSLRHGPPRRRRAGLAFAGDAEDDSQPPSSASASADGRPMEIEAEGEQAETDADFDATTADADTETAADADTVADAASCAADAADAPIAVLSEDAFAMQLEQLPRVLAAVDSVASIKNMLSDCCGLFSPGSISQVTLGTYPSTSCGSKTHVNSSLSLLSCGSGPAKPRLATGLAKEQQARDVHVDPALLYRIIA